MEDCILLVDDEPNIISSLKRVLMDEQYTIFSANSGAEALDILKEQRIKVVISDERMPGMSGAEFLSIVRNRFPGVVRIVLTGHASIEAAMSAVNNGEIYRFFTKPWNDVELKLSIRSAVEKHDLEAENRRLLSIVRTQALELKLLEKRYPNITKIERDDDGNLILPDISDEDLSAIVAQCEREFT
ncbi:MAG TPA: response regulator [Nitrospirae bacterium]|nr:response regulator [Nitrospirota bacterium]